MYQVYRILLQHSPVVQPLYVAEASVDRTSLGFDQHSTELHALVTDWFFPCVSLLNRPCLPQPLNKFLLSRQVYRILLQHSPVVQPLSVDEAFLDLSSLGFDLRSAELQALVTQMRQEIHTTTGCTASAGEWRGRPLVPYY
jgi:hypothetical protein